MKNIIKNHLDDHMNVVKSIDENHMEAIQDIAKVISNALMVGGIIYWCGNGGSCSDSQHLAGELIGRFKNDRRPLRSIALSSDTSVLTCIANDYGYNSVYSRQIEGLGKKNDVLVGITTSGRSKNITEAIKQASSMKLKTVGFLGRDGGDLKDFCDHTIIIPSNSTARIQEMHIMIGHIICELVEQELNL
jgi:D-sedoheptulose 7-phosphate isomerase